MAKTFDEIPLTRPSTPLLDRIDRPADLRALPREQLHQVVDELRAYLLLIGWLTPARVVWSAI